MRPSAPTTFHQTTHISFCHTCSLLPPWQATPTSDAENQKRSGQTRGINPAQAANLSSPEGAVGELGGDSSSASSASIAFRDCPPSAKPILILQYLGILPFWARCRGLVHDLKVTPTEYTPSTRLMQTA